jgi:hypothetical protein
MTAAIPFAAVGLAALYANLARSRGGRIVMGSLCVLLPLWQYFQLIQHKIVLPYNHPQFIAAALRNVPLIVSDYPGALLRSSCWPRLVFLARVPLRTAMDWLMLVGVPVMLVLLAAGCVAAFRSASATRATARPCRRRRADLLVAGILLLLASLPILVRVTNPPKSPAEIDARQQEASRIKALGAPLRQRALFLEPDDVRRFLATRSKP